jgi:Cdc6-like AAA superfamily ATPase
MKLRNDLWKDAQRPAVFAELKKRVQDLLSHSEWTTLLLRGPWGCGKTSAIKSLLNEAKDSSNNDRIKVGTYSFVSLAGISKIADERSLFLAGFESWNDLPLDRLRGATKAFGKFAKTILAAGGLGSRAEGLSDLFAMAVTPLMKGALVILDDLERRSEDLPIGDVLGVAMRLVEQRGCKVIVISNEDKLKERDKNDLDVAREKVFDLEFLFNPRLLKRFRLSQRARETASD